MEQTLVLVKPDGVKKNLIGDIIARFEHKGLQVAALKLVKVTEAQAKFHYAEHEGKPFFGELVDFITSAPLVCAVIRGENAIKAVRQLNGATNPIEAVPGSIRGDFALSIGLHLLLQTTGLLHQPTRFLRELNNQMLFRREHAGQRSLHALQRQRLPAQRKVDTLVRGLNSGADPLLHILQIAEQAACHQHIAQQQPQEQGPHLASH